MGIFDKVKKRLKGEDNLCSDYPSAEVSSVGPLSSMLGPSGRITLASLKWFFNESSKRDFMEFVQNPVLAGSALNAENLAAMEHSYDESAEKSTLTKSGNTIVVNIDDHLSKKSGPGTSLPYAIYPLIKRLDAQSPAHTFTIGRTRENDMIMKDLAISKKHALIRISKGSFFIADCRSTNGTRINGKRIADKPVPLNDRDLIELGNYKFTFLFPSSLHDLLNKM
jgi:hypothetical protein